MQMLAVVILGNEGKELKRRSQPDPARSFPNKRSGRGAKCSHLWQPWNIRRTIAGFHCKPHFTNPPIPAYCFSLPHCRAFRTTPKPCLFASDWPWKHEEGSHPGSSVMKSPIGHHVLCGNQALYSRLAALSCNRSRCIFLQLVSTRDAHPPPGKAPCLANWLWLHKIATCVRSFKIYDDQKCHWKSWSAILGCNCILLITITG